VTDPIARMAQFLAGHVEWIRHRQEANEFLSAVDACLRVVRGLARGSSERRYLGPCTARIEALSDETGVRVSEECPGHIYAHIGAQTGRCDNADCKAAVAVGDREAWINELARSYAFTDSEISDAYRINIKTIRTWRDRGQLLPHGFDGYDKRGNPCPTYNVGDVLDLAAADAARRETDRAKRARRRDTKTEEDAA
jgi:hypothetical protein